MQFTEQFFLEIIRKWKFGWMNQRQNSEVDFQNYFNRAFGIDANMQHSLAKQLMKAVQDVSTDEKMEEVMTSLRNLHQMVTFGQNDRTLQVEHIKQAGKLIKEYFEVAKGNPKC